MAFSSPGDGGEASLMAMAPEMAEIMLCGTFRFTAYWNPKVVTDEKGEATVSFILPDNLMTFRVMAVAQTKDSKFGQGEATFRVSKKLMLQPSTPRFCRVGDTFEAGVVAHNFSAPREELVLNVRSTGLTPKDKRAVHRVSDPPGESWEILFPFQAEKPGEAILAFEGRMGKESDGLEVKIPVYLPRPTESVALYGEISSQELGKKVAATEKNYSSRDQISRKWLAGNQGILLNVGRAGGKSPEPCQLSLRLFGTTRIFASSLLGGQRIAR